MSEKTQMAPVPRLRSPAQIIGKDALLQLIFEGYAVVSATEVNGLRDALATLLELHDALGSGQSYAATKARAALATGEASR